MRRVNPETLEIEEIENDGKIYVYVLSEEGSWDYEDTSTIEIFKNFNSGLKAFFKKVKDVEQDMKEWCDEDDLQSEKPDVQRDTQYAYYEIYEDGDFDRLHSVVKLEKKEVM